MKIANSDRSFEKSWYINDATLKMRGFYTKSVQALDTQVEYILLLINF